MRVLVACEFSGVVRDAFMERGHTAWSCDLRPTESGDNHITGDVLGVLAGKWDLMIAHPPCTYLSVSGLHWNKRRPGRATLTAQAYEFFMKLWNCDIPRIAIENPVGCMSRLFRKPDQIIQPYEFGADASKKTCLWLKNLAPLKIDPGARKSGRMVNGRERWANQTDNGQNRLGPSADRAALRAVTYPQIAAAMADQWGIL